MTPTVPVARSNAAGSLTTVRPSPHSSASAGQTAENESPSEKRVSCGTRQAPQGVARGWSAIIAAAGTAVVVIAVTIVVAEGLEGRDDVRAHERGIDAAGTGSRRIDHCRAA